MTDMDLKVYAVFDKKGNVFDVPFFARNDLFAGRRFMIDIKGERAKDSMIGTFSDDFDLYRVGSFNFESGAFSGCERVCILKGSEVDKNA